MRDDFGIGLSLEDVTLGLQLLLQGQIVLHNSVVHHNQVTGAVAVRVGVLFGGSAMSSPAGMADAVAPVNRVHGQNIFQIAQLA